MKRFILITIVATISYAGSARALVGVGVGVEVGSASYTGDVLPSSGDVGTGTRYGVVFGLGALPVFDLEVRARYFKRDFNYTYSAAGVPVSTAFEFQDASAVALLKANLFAPPLSPFSLYAGAGLGLHVMNTDVALQLASGAVSPGQADNPFTLLDKTSRTSGLGVLGLRVSPPGFPLAIFGEASYEAIFADSRLNVTEVSAGLMLQF